MYHVANTHGQGSTCIITITHALTVGWIAKINEIMSTSFLKLNLQDPLVVKHKTELRKEDLEEFKYVLIDFAQTKSTTNTPYMSP